MLFARLQPLSVQPGNSFAILFRRNTHYETLGVPRTASKSQIKSHFYKLSKLHHPDVSKNLESQTLFRKVSEAYAVLSNDRERRAYDRNVLHRAPSANAHSQQPFQPRAPPNRASRASYAWEYRSREYRRPAAHDHPYGSNSASSADSDPFYGGTQAYQHAMRPDVLVGARRQTEEEDRRNDKLRNELPLLRASQVTGLLLFATAIFGGFGR